MPYFSETDKIREILDPKYLEGKVIDIGCGDHKIKPDAVGVDGRDTLGATFILQSEYAIYTLHHHPKMKDADTVFSSHCLEHLRDDYAAIISWSMLIKKDGYLILYLPDGRYYNNNDNLEHMRDHTYDNFIFWFQRVFCGLGKNYKGESFTPIFQLIESGLDIRPDCYSFYIIAQKV